MPLSNIRELFLDNCWIAEAGEEARLKGVEDPAFNCRASFKAAGVKLLTSLSLPEERNDFLCFRFCLPLLDIFPSEVLISRPKLSLREMGCMTNSGTSLCCDH